MAENLNRRKFLVLGSAAFGASLLKACATTPTPGGSPSAQGSPSASPVAGKIKVASVYTVPIEQQWVSRIHKALEAAKGRGDIDYVYSENVTNTDYERVMRQYAEGGNQLIIGEAFAVEKACRDVAKSYPKVSFLMGSSGKPDGANFSVFDNYIHEPSYLTGMIAGGMTKSKVIGMVGGYPIPEVNRLMHAFMAGARETQPNVKFLVTFIEVGLIRPRQKKPPLHRFLRGQILCTPSDLGYPTRPKKRKYSRSVTLLIPRRIIPTL